jgi:eukaryotic-like serine/threonine-protein kinase
VTKLTQCPTCGTEFSSDASATGACPRCTSASALADLLRTAPQSPAPPLSELEKTKPESFPDVIHADLITAAIAGGDERPLSPGLPPSLAGYMIIGPPMRGGMGTVWPAKQLGTRRTVAIKMLGTQHLTGPGRVRFVREVELSAKLQHPNIARIYDSGVHQGDYFYAMEMIDGLSLDQCVAKRKLNQAQILELMRLVAQAVQHAHLRGVIHCDLKPANILVSEDGQPHVLDFGLALLTTTRPDGLTENGSAPGTPSYMSPEQAGGLLEKIDVRTDVYSLGKILYQLLTGQPAHRLDGPITDVLRRIATQEIQPPRQAAPKLNRELSALLLKALNHDPEKRYASAGELGRDIQHFQAGEPLAAVRSSTLYLLRKRMAKHRLFLSMAAALLLSLGIMAGFSYRRVSREAAKSNAINHLLQDVLSKIDPKSSGGRDVTAEILAGVDNYLRKSSPLEPALEADVRDTLGGDMYSLGLFAAAEEQYAKAVALRRSALGENKPQTLASLGHLAVIYRERGKLKEAAEISQQVLHSFEATVGRDNPQTLRARTTLAYVLNDMGRGKEVEAPLRDALTRAKSRLGESDEDTMSAAAALVIVLRDIGGSGPLREAADLGARTLSLRKTKFGVSTPDTIQSMHDLGTVLSMQGSFIEAEKLYREALRIGEMVMARPSVQSNLGAATHPDLLIWKSDLAFNLQAQGKLDKAATMYEEVLAASCKSRGDRHPYNVLLRCDLGSVLVRLNRYHDAERYFREVVEIQKDWPDGQPPDPLQFKDALASVLSAQGQWDESVQLYSETLDAQKKRLPADAPPVLAAAENLRKAQAWQAEAARIRTGSGGAGGKTNPPK